MTATFVHGDLVSARDEARRAYHQFYRRDLHWASRFRLFEAYVLVCQGLSQDVLSLLDSSLPSTLDGDLAIQRAMYRGIAYAHLGRFGDADRSLAEAQRRVAASRSRLAGEVVRARGVVESDRGDLAQAERYFHASLLIAREQKDTFLEATALLNLGVVALRQEHFDPAIDWTKASYKSAQAMSAMQIEEIALGNIAWAYYKLGDYEKAASLFEEAEKKANDVGSVIDRTAWLNSLGLISEQTNQLTDAEKYYKQSLALAEATQNQEQIADVMSELASMLAQNGDPGTASRYSQQAIASARSRGDRATELYPLLVEGLLAARKGDNRKAENTFLEVARDPKSDVSLRWEAEHELAKLYATENRIAQADQQYQTALATFENARAELQQEDSKLPFLTNAANIYADYVEFLVRQGKTVEALELADFSRAQTLADGLRSPGPKSASTPRKLNARQIARQMGATVLFYWLGRKQSYLWAVAPDRIELFPLPPASEIEALVQSYRKALLGPRDALETNNADGVKLFRILVAPARELVAHSSRVITIPDGNLNNLNFETLLVPEPKLHYWIEDATISQASSLRLLAASRASSRSLGKLLLIGDPIAPNHEFGRLQQAEVEIQKIASHFEPRAQRVFRGEHATAAAYLSNRPEEFSFIHFVAHGTASRLSPLDSAVVLSKSSAEEDSFKLYARDIIRRPLRAELVTISSCYGAGARAYSGEGLIGLSWAFLRAGAHNVVGALWEVSDVSTPQLMDEFYRQIRSGNRPQVALRAAKLSLLRSNSVFRKPFYWAPFQLYTGS